MCIHSVPLLEQFPGPRVGLQVLQQVLPQLRRQVGCSTWAAEAGGGWSGGLRPSKQPNTPLPPTQPYGPMSQPIAALPDQLKQTPPAERWQASCRCLHTALHRLETATRVQQDNLWHTQHTAVQGCGTATKVLAHATRSRPVLRWKTSCRCLDTALQVAGSQTATPNTQWVRQNTADLSCGGRRAAAAWTRTA